MDKSMLLDQTHFKFAYIGWENQEIGLSLLEVS